MEVDVDLRQLTLAAERAASMHIAAHRCTWMQVTEQMLAVARPVHVARAGGL